MKLEVKSTLLLLGTLLLGVMLGMVGQGMLQRERAAQVGELRRPPGFVAHMSQMIDPTDAQRDTVTAILEATAVENQRVIDEAQRTLRASLNAMRTRLAPVLTEAQRNRLASMERLPDPFRPLPRGAGRPDGGPPPPGGPPPGGPDGGAPPRR